MAQFYLLSDGIPAAKEAVRYNIDGEWKYSGMKLKRISEQKANIRSSASDCKSDL